MKQIVTTARCPLIGQQWPAQRDPNQPITCPGCGNPVTLTVDVRGGETYLPDHTTIPDTGAYGLYVTHRSGGHINIHPWARFADRQDATRAATTYQSERGPVRQQSFGPVSVKAYPGEAPTMTFAQWAAGGRHGPTGSTR